MGLQFIGFTFPMITCGILDIHSGRNIFRKISLEHGCRVADLLITSLSNWYESTKKTGKKTHSTRFLYINHCVSVIISLMWTITKYVVFEFTKIDKNKKESTEKKIWNHCASIPWREFVIECTWKPTPISLHHCVANAILAPHLIWQMEISIL